jgi:hypothetical protein
LPRPWAGRHARYDEELVGTLLYGMLRRTAPNEHLETLPEKNLLSLSSTFNDLFFISSFY